VSVFNLKKLFHPGSVALIGASNTTNSIGQVILKNILAGGFQGPIYAVNPKYKFIQGQPCYQHIAELPAAPDLAVICTPASTVPAIITELGKYGTRAAIVITSGFNQEIDGLSLHQKMLNAAQPFNLRILGPNCVGMLNPDIGLNASFAHTYSLKGNIALVSQSGAICTAILDWAKSRGVGFSYFISLGDSTDVDVGDVLNFLSTDHLTHSIFLYLESIREARKFISAARATSRNKKIIVIKSGRFEEGARAAASHTGALAGNDDVFDAAINRTGTLRVYTIQNLFDAVETLAHTRTVRGNRLIIITNGGGVGVLATDTLVYHGGKLAQLVPETINALNRSLPPAWSHANPVDIIGDGDAERYVKALKILLKDPGYDAILVMLVPVAVIDNALVAQAVTAAINETTRPVFTCWMGEDAVESARKIFEQAGIPTYDTPESAIRAFMQIVEYENNQKALIEIPPSVPEEFEPDTETVHRIIQQALLDNRDILSEHETKSILVAYGIPVVETLFARNADEALAFAEQTGYPVVIKIISPQISHKSDVGGVLLNIESPAILSAAAEGMLARVKRIRPDAIIEGFTVQKMIERPGAHELIIGVSTDPVFGPVILFGQGGISVEIVKDRAIALPPLNLKLARDLIERTRVYNILKGYRNITPADVTAIELTLIKISQLVIDQPEICELDINPLFADSKGVLALDARMKIKPYHGKPGKHLSIRPYPRELEEQVTLRSGEIIRIRPIKPEDEPAHQEFLEKTSPEDRYFRFFRSVDDIGHSQMARFTQIDYDREMAFVARATDETGHEETIGVVRIVCDSDASEGEFSIIIRTDKQQLGLGTILMDKIIRYSKTKGVKKLSGQILLENKAMLNLAHKFNFSSTVDHGDNVAFINLDVRKSA
jgi:acetyltransferase